MTRKFLHVGCGRKAKAETTIGFSNENWKEIRLDIDADVNPDVVGSMLNMEEVRTETFDAIYSSHNIEHVYPHEVPVALSEFHRVLKPDGFVALTCPDLQSVAALIADDKLTEAAYNSPVGDITPLDIFYGHGASIERGHHYMAHKTGFTLKTLFEAFKTAGFSTSCGLKRGKPFYDLWILASKSDRDESTLRNLASSHFPMNQNNVAK